MENTYAAEVAVLGTNELLGLLQAREQYEPEIILAVITELECREVLVPDLEEIKAYTQAVYNAKVEMESQPKTPAEKLQEALQVFVPRREYYITPILLDINLLVFVLMLFLGISFISPEAGQLFSIGGNFGPYTLSGQWWRLLTSTFLHGGIIHLALNMLALISVGRQLEQMIGRVPFLVAYILCGLAGSLVSVWWDGTRVSVGASGAIFGMFGLLLTLMALEKKLSWEEKKAMLGNLVLVIGINLVYGIKGGIDNAAHAGGLAGGILFGLVLMARSRRVITPAYNLAGNAVMAGIGLIVLTVAYNVVPFDGQTRYLYTLDQVGRKEVQAMQPFWKLAEEGEAAQAKEFVPQLQEGIALWEESEQLLEVIDDVEGQEKDRVSVMLDYVRLRKKSYEMLVADMQQNNPLLNQKQQQVLEAIDYYLTALQQNKESEVVSGNSETAEAMPKVAIPRNDAETEQNTVPAQVLLVVDNVKVGYVAPDKMPEEVTNLKSEEIKDVLILKGEQAREAYGEEGANGVIVITSRK